jgi:insulysin
LIGNKETLETIPLSKGVNIRNRLMSFYYDNYVANQMTLCVLGKESLTDLEKLVKECFTNIRSNDKHRAPPLKWWGKIEPYIKNKYNAAVLTNVVPVSETRRLTLSFPVWINSPSVRAKLLKTKPESIISHLIGHEGEGSLRSYLVSKGWANCVNTGISNDVSDLQMFDVNIELTENGFNEHNQNNIIESIFAYITMLKRDGIPDYVYNEVKKLSEINFKFAEKSEPMSFVSNIVTDMQLYGPQSYITGSRFIEPNHSICMEYLNYLNVSNCKIRLISTNLKNKTNRKGRYYGTDYSTTLLIKKSHDWSHRYDSI